MASQRDAAVRAARRRHPSAGRWRVDVVRAAERLAAAVPVAGAHHHVAAAVMAARGAAGADRAAFADALGVDVATIVALEAGHVPPHDAPARLRHAPWWAAATRCSDEGAGGTCTHRTG